MPVSLAFGIIASLAVLAARAGTVATGSSPTVEGELRVWHAVTITLDGPEAAEGAAPNPFRDYRLQVTFEHGNRAIVVPGYFAADGHAAESGASRGNKWRVHFMPDAPGRWTWRASMRQGSDVAVSADAGGGRPVPPDGAGGVLTIEPTDKQAPDFRRRGLLRHAGGHHLQFAGTGEFFLKGGADSPENFLAYRDFDNTTTSVAPRREGEAERALHAYRPHEGDWRAGDPTWRGGRGKGIIGALNYLASQGMNSVYFLTMNVGGDGDDVFPWVSREQRDRFDVSKLDQWNLVFAHMTRLGLMLHVVTQETENQTLLDEGALGPVRRLYYRELIARFGHHPAITWNLGEENGEAREGAPFNTDGQRKAFARFIKDLDPYDHPVVVHTWPGKQERIYGPLLGEPALDGPSLQIHHAQDVYRETRKWRERSAAAGRPWFVSLDELGPADTGVKPDADDPGHDEVRIHALWGHLMAGGAGVEWYFGYNYAHNDLNAEDWRSRERMWRLTRHALQFFQRNVAFHEARPLDGLLSDSDAHLLAVPSQSYVIHLPNGGTTSLDLRQAQGTFDVRWFDPRSGGDLQRGSIESVRGGNVSPLGTPPSEPSADWVVLVSSRR
jgi:Domain of unknown function (DUF5060)/Putative collagen-binding domain of a collagenase